MSKEETATIGTLWQTMGGGNGRLGRTSRVFPLPAQLERTLPMRGSVSASPVFDREENVYLADMSGEVQAYSAGGGSLWQRDLEEGIYATPALNPEGKVLYVGTIRGNVAALNATDGAVLWRTNIVRRTIPASWPTCSTCRKRAGGGAVRAGFFSCHELVTTHPACGR